MLLCMLNIIIIALGLCRVCFSSIIFGFKTESSVYLSAPEYISINGVSLRSENWLRSIDSDDRTCIAMQGDLSDCEFLYDRLFQENRKHELMFQDRPLSVHAVANICRKIIASQLRSPQSLKLNALIAGWDNKRKAPLLFWLDNLGGLQEVPFAAHGKDFVFLLSLFDRKSNTPSIKSLEGCESIDAQIPGEINLKISGGKGISSLSPAEAQGLIKDCWSCIRKRSTSDNTRSVSWRCISCNETKFNRFIPDNI